MPLIDRNIHHHTIFCYLANDSNTANMSRDVSGYYYRYPNSILVGLMDRFDSNSGFLLHIGPDSKCEFFQVTSVPGFIADENATRVTLQYRWFNRNPSMITGLKESIVSFLDNASKSDIYITASFASLMGFFGTVLGKLFGVDSDDTETFKKTIAFIAYIFQQGKAIIQEKDILSFGGMDIPSNTFTFRKTYITLSYADNLTSIDMAINDIMTLKLFPGIMGFVEEADETGGASKSDMVQLIASIITSVFLDSLRRISCNLIYTTQYKNANTKLNSDERIKERINKLALPEGKGNSYRYINICVPVKKADEEKRLVDKSNKILLCLYELADDYNESKYEKHLNPEVISHFLNSLGDLNINIYKEIIPILTSHQYPILLYNCLTKWLSTISNIVCFEEPIKMDKYLKYMYNRALLMPFFLLTNIDEYIKQKEKEDNTENLVDSYETYKDDIEDYLESLGINEIKSTNTYDLNSSLSDFQSVMQEALKYINEKMLVNSTTYVIDSEKLLDEVLQSVVHINVGRVMLQERLPYDFTDPATIIRSIIQKADTLKFQKVHHNVVQFLYKFGIMIVKPPGGYHFIPDYRAIIGAIIHGRPCIQMDTGFEELQAITYKLAYYGFTYRNIFRNILGVVDGDTALNSTHLSYMLPSQLTLSSSETFTYAPLPTQYAEPAVPTWTKLEVSFTPMNNFIFFFGNYANLYDLYDGLGLDTLFASQSNNAS